MTERERSIENMCRDIAKEAESCSQTIEQIGLRIEEKPDSCEQVKGSPYWALGVAAALGYFASRLFQARSAPSERFKDSGAEEVHDSRGDLHSGSTVLSLIKVTLLGIAAKAATDWILNTASSSVTCCGDTEPRPKPGGNSTSNPKTDT